MWLSGNLTMSFPLVKLNEKVSSICRRNLGIFAPVLQKSNDPIQQLFLDKIREYKSKSSGGKQLIDPSPEMQKELQNDKERIYKQFNLKSGEDLTKFPSLTFTDPKIEKPTIPPKEKQP